MMENNTKQAHWDDIYASKTLEERTWYESVPRVSLDFIEQFSIAKDAAIIDIGGGDSLLIDHLLDRGFQNLTVLDISQKALEKAQIRLGSRAKQIKWIVADVTLFDPQKKYDFWHDRAAFHFLITETDVQSYVETIGKAVVPGGFAVIGTFSEQGPTKCSGLEIKQYAEQSLSETFAADFRTIKCITVDHHTPSNATQNFTFCSFQRLK